VPSPTAALSVEPVRKQSIAPLLEHSGVFLAGAMRPGTIGTQEAVTAHALALWQSRPAAADGAGPLACEALEAREAGRVHHCCSRTSACSITRGSSRVASASPASAASATNDAHAHAPAALTQAGQGACTALLTRLLGTSTHTLQ
jgi:hypothetical protein